MTLSALAITMAALATGLFAGAAIYVSGVEQLLGSVVPFTLIVILPTNKRLLDPTLDPQGAELSHLLGRWGQLHAVRSVLGSVAFLILLVRLVMRGSG